ncbi:uncharacterized protein [Palaemon carinicauda]|uniref:uncharacterized protein isoform X8 n=1 Tax=Palaemon carinicauda TaxID=392227 RepID=UPI0035B5ECE0
MKLNVVLLLAVVNFIHGDECKLLFDLAIVEIGGSLRTIYNHLKGHDQLLQRIPDMQEKLEHLENNLQDMQEKLEHLENNLQGLSRDTAQCLKGEDLENLTNVSAAANEEIKSYVHEEISGVISLAQGHDELLQKIPDMQEKLQHLENNLQDVQQEQGNLKSYFQGLSRETAQCLKGEDLEHLTNVSAATNQEIKSFVHEEISGVISLAQKDECLEGGLPCGEIGTCENTLFSFTCSCPSGFTWDGSECKEFQCRSPAKRVPGVGCLMLIEQRLTFQAMKKKCEEEGMRLAQHMSLQQLQDMVDSFRYNGWVGVYDGKWTSDGSLVPEDLWEEGYRSDPSRRCGIIGWVSSSSSYKLYQDNCSYKLYGYCQFPMP